MIRMEHNLPDLGRHQSLHLRPPHTQSRVGDRLNHQIQSIAELDRIIHEPGRLMIITLLYSVDQADFLYMQYETGMNKGTLSSHISRLEQAEYIHVEKTFRGKVPQTLLRLTRMGRKSFERYRKNLREAL